MITWNIIAVELTMINFSGKKAIFNNFWKYNLHINTNSELEFFNLTNFPNYHLSEIFQTNKC